MRQCMLLPLLLDLLGLQRSSALSATCACTYQCVSVPDCLSLVCVQGKTSLEAVQLVADLVRKKRCVVDPAVVGALLVMRFEAVTPTQQGGEGVGRQAAKVRGRGQLTEQMGRGR